jgi:hypothetical protein
VGLRRKFNNSTVAAEPPVGYKVHQSIGKKAAGWQRQRLLCEPIFFQARIARLCSRTIWAVQNAIITGKSVVSFMNDLVAQLVPKEGLIVEH